MKKLKEFLQKDGKQIKIIKGVSNPYTSSDYAKSVIVPFSEAKNEMIRVMAEALELLKHPFDPGRLMEEMLVRPEVANQTLVRIEELAGKLLETK